MITEYLLSISAADDDMPRLMTLLNQRVSEFAVAPTFVSSGPRGRRQQELKFAACQINAPDLNLIKQCMDAAYLPRYKISTTQRPED